MKSRIKIGTRGSQLALYQAEQVRSALQAVYPDIRYELVKIKTTGDLDQQGNTRSVGQRIFTSQIEDALLGKDIDLAVHSAKDLSATLPAGLGLGAVLEREDSRDCVIARDQIPILDLPRGAKIGTSSLRRRAQIKMIRSDFELLDLRGNVDTRIKKIKRGDCDATILAYAGLKRLGLEKEATEILEVEKFLPQVGQGIIAVEVREDDDETREVVEAINHLESFKVLLGERSFLNALDGGCQVPVGITSKISGGKIILKGAIFSLDGERKTEAVISGPIQAAEEQGVLLAEQLLVQGGRELLDEIKKPSL